MIKKFFVFCFVIVISFSATAQSTSDYAVQLTASVQVSPPAVTLHWVNDVNATQYLVYKKTTVALGWGSSIATLAGTSNQFIDNNVVADSAYEYRVQKNTATYTAQGYIYAGINAPPIHYRGKLLLFVDSLFADTLHAEIFQLMKDISGDGWAVEKFVVGRNDSVTHVKTIIYNLYNADPQNIKAVLLLGHIPVPYSGDINPDGHPDHLGGWPADVYYGEFDAFWTDLTVNDSLASRPENQNRIGDGKFDQSMIPSNVDLQVSRIDFNNMPSFTQGEIALMKNYLLKSHRYKLNQLAISKRGIVDDNFGVFGGEAFASNGWRNMSPLVGDSNIYSLDFIPTLDSINCQWAYGCGGGWYQGAGGIGSTTNFVNDSAKAIFTMLFGSYFGDWDSQDNFLRAPLCANDPALTCCWVGRPYWFFHHMAMGENIGYSARLSQNNSPTYSANYGMRFVHIALMGDLTLREDAMTPSSNLAVFVPTGGAGANINWSASPDNPIGYYVYRSQSEFGKYDLISPLIVGNNFLDTIGTSGLQYYMVRAAKNMLTPSGTYINLSEGISDSMTVMFSSGIQHANVSSTINIFPNPASENLFINFSASPFGNMSVYDVTGKCLFTRKTFSHFEQLNISGFTNGTYFLKFENEKETIIKKFVVLK